MSRPTLASEKELIAEYGNGCGPAPIIIWPYSKEEAEGLAKTGDFNEETHERLLVTVAMLWRNSEEQSQAMAKMATVFAKQLAKARKDRDEMDAARLNSLRASDKAHEHLADYKAECEDLKKRLAALGKLRGYGKTDLGFQVVLYDDIQKAAEQLLGKYPVLQGQDGIAMIGGGGGGCSIGGYKTVDGSEYAHRTLDGGEAILPLDKYGKGGCTNCPIFAFEGTAKELHSNFLMHRFPSLAELDAAKTLRKMIANHMVDRDWSIRCAVSVRRSSATRLICRLDLDGSTFVQPLVIR